MRRRLRRRRPGPGPAPDPLLAAMWEERPATRAWIAGEVLADPLLEVMGPAWAAATRTGLLRGERRATEQATLACGPVVLAAALRAAR